ncbi:MAG: MBL fold metallo-hydrolase [Myxococcales bacterium]|nr:MBL fold metallo-hydrolase [Polyangiaceae bacterium]MDW8250739.1 MBL fold metallo-hydrolase [Myxococcales bacterium]
MIRPHLIAPGLASFPTRTPTLPPATHTCSYALGEREVLLVEPATPDPEEQQAWVEWARGLRSSGRTLVALLATHHHHDHVAGAAFFAQALGLPLWAHEATATRIAVPVERRWREGEELVLDGPVPQRWRMLHTPGHAPGHLCLHEPECRWLVVGDMVASVGTILIAPGEGDMAEYLRQLERLASLNVALALPAHGNPIDRPTDLFRRYLHHRLARERKVLEAVVEGKPEGQRLEEILLRAYEDTPTTLYGIAALSLQAHLDKLVAEGRVVRAGDRYTAGVDA